MAVVEIRNLKKTFSGANAVESLNLTTEDGEFIVIVGPSGCGKSTTMRMIAGLEEVSGGSILIDGQDVTDLSPTERDVAMVFQNYALYPHLTVYDNMAFCLQVRKWPKARIDERVRAVAESLSLTPLLQRKPAALSGGQRQRVALGRAIVREPRIFIMDEPLSNLDAKLRVDMRGEITKLCRRLKVTTFYVTHDQLEALTMGHRIIVMRNGVAQQIDTPQRIYDEPVNRFVASFIGSPSMNFLEATVEGDGQILRGPGFQLRVSDRIARALKESSETKVVAGIRPEHLFPVADGDSAGGWVQGRIELVEPLGSQVMVQVMVGNSVIVAQFERQPGLDVGRAITLQHKTDAPHAFDVETERTVLAAAPAESPAALASA
ncbi:Oligosaccharides import ATP-binding protein MsmX [Paraburkholderia nemoris]|uniref:ABC transporter ATP-binding protein n=1 Tax=Paraburkholderia nemoris TaxID=2793076 RepID=UPI00190AC110|nr:ABC transporter ATP-binding protein [Paraburkholderia nemoris]MBK3744701.1 ABC transporter ATP-binding protein [Paraburkholderia aspalathi]CAE6847277.1 Oligosaccharides import ATP-binding protein MsmX [Paraburkholderia nemoris]